MTREQVRAFDAWAIEEVGVPGAVLMENAGRACAELLAEQLKGISKPKVCIFCGTGNNGGDGFVTARHLFNRGFEVTAVICGDRTKIKGDAKINLDIFEIVGGRIEQLKMSSDEDIEQRVGRLAAGANVIADAIFGTGLEGALRDEYKRLIEGINARGCKVLAVDIPSGLDCDTGRPLGTAVRADWTVTFVAVKRGFVEDCARQYTGQVYVASIGVSPGPGGKISRMFSSLGSFEADQPI